MPNVQTKINRAGVIALLHDEGVARYLHELAERVAAAAGPDVFVVDDLSGGYRARSEVHDVQPGAIEREAQTHRLARALEAAR